MFLNYELYALSSNPNFYSESNQLEHLFEEHLNESDNLGSEEYIDNSMSNQNTKRRSNESAVLEACVCEFCNKTFYGRQNLYAHR